MRFMTNTRSMLCAAVLLLTTASPGAGQVMEGPDGPVEFVGLKEWRARDLFEAIQELAPDQPFHACAAVMELELGFAEAAAMSYRTRGSDEVYTVVVGVEDLTRVRYRAVGSETLGLPDTWRKLKATAEEDLYILTSAARTLHSREDTEWIGADPEVLEEVWTRIDRADGRRDHRLAHELLARDVSWSARAIATLVLGNFMDRDTSWHGLVLSLTDPEDRVTHVAQSLLQGLIYSDSRRPVEWSAAREPLLAHFGGTNPWSFDLVLRVLVATEVDPEFGRQLARERPDLLLAYAGAEHRGTRQPAIAFLRTVSGEDFGTDLQAWTAWINGQSDDRDQSPPAR
ncbi:hypothetical protein [Candidatus Palauibacter sp.]|uniref:hypothetical protein n=1 Tax=Candidatus Palauibacter sp. TaxID=3101350 RepID=UPI003AF2B102